MNEYEQNPEKDDIALNGLLRVTPPRSVPWTNAVEEIGCEHTEDAYDRIMWGLATLYGPPLRDNNGKVIRVMKKVGNKMEEKVVHCRKEYKPTSIRESRRGVPWTKKDAWILKHAMLGEGQERVPPCDIESTAKVLARDVSEVASRWKNKSKDPLGREGLGLV